MTEYLNQSIGSFDDKSHEYVSVWFDEATVKAFSFHSIMVKDVMGKGHRFHGCTIDARSIFAAIAAFNASPTRAIGLDGQDYWITQIWNERDNSTELRIGGRFGRPVARMVKTGYIQNADRLDREASTNPTPA